MYRFFSNIAPIGLLACFFLLPISPAFAQLNFSTAGNSAVVGSRWFTFNPETPGPREDVTVTFVTYAGELSTAEVAWVVDGAPVASGIGLTSTVVSTGDIGEPTTIDVAVRFADGKTLSHSTTITPGRVALLWETDSYVAPFYRGKALRGMGQPITLIALPTLVQDGEPLNPEQLLYEWYLGPSKLSVSGVGRQRVTVEESSMRTYKNVRLVVSTVDRSVSATGYLNVPTTFPRLTVYLNDPLYGILFNRAAVGTIKTSGEFELRAEPYFFSRENLRKGAVSVNWSLGGRPVQNESFLQSFAPTANTSGTASIRVRAADQENFLMQSESSVSINYGNEKNVLF